MVYVCVCVWMCVYVLYVCVCVRAFVKNRLRKERVNELPSLSVLLYALPTLSLTDKAGTAAPSGHYYWVNHVL